MAHTDFFNPLPPSPPPPTLLLSGSPPGSLSSLLSLSRPSSGGGGPPRQRANELRGNYCAAPPASRSSPATQWSSHSLLPRRRARIRSLPPVRRRGAADGLEGGPKLLLELPPWRSSSNAAALLRRPYSCGSGGGGARAVVTRSCGAPLQRRRWRIEQGLELHGRGREGRAQAGAEHGGGPSARGGAEWSSVAAFLPPSGAMCGGPVTGWRRPSITPDSKEPRGRRLFGVLLQDAAAGHFTGKGDGKKIQEGITYPGAGGLSALDNHQY
jgi:hypothetical protein